MNTCKITKHIVIIASLVGNLIFFLSDGITYLRTKELELKNKNSFPKAANIEHFHRQIFSKNLDILTTGNRPDVPNFPSGVIERIKYNLSIGQPHYPFFEGGEPNWLLFATLEDAIERNDISSVHSLSKVFDSKILNTDITQVDCALGGGCAILLYKRTHDKKYRDYAYKMFRWLKGHDTEYGIIYRGNKDSRFQLNDGYGMYMPFLNMFAQVFSDTTASNLFQKQVEIASLYLMDNVSGIPVHGFTLKNNHSKVMQCNFGRGVAWFVLGLLDFNTTNASDRCNTLVARLDSTLCKIWESERCFTQFIGQGGERDLSAELPILYYLMHKHLIKISDEQLLNYSTMAENGLLYHSSGSVTTTYSNLFGPNILAQAFMLKLLNDFNK